MSLGIRKPYICTSIQICATTCTVHMHVDMQKCVIEHVRSNRATDQFGLNNFLAMPCYYNVSRLWCTLHMWHTRDAIYIIVIFVHEKKGSHQLQTLDFKDGMTSNCYTCALCMCMCMCLCRFYLFLFISIYKCIYGCSFLCFFSLFCFIFVKMPKGRRIHVADANASSILVFGRLLLAWITLNLLEITDIFRCSFPQHTQSISHSRTFCLAPFFYLL